MELVARIVYYILLVFVRIGDGVLFLFALLTTFLKKAISAIASFTNHFLSFPKSYKIKNSFRFPKISFLVQKVHLPQKSQKRGRPRIKKQGDIVVFTISRLTKFKYFSYGIIFSLLFVFLPLLVYLFLQELPHPSALTQRQIPQTTKIYDRNGTLLHQIYSQQNRTIIPLSQIPEDLQEATIAIEDQNFYHHPGFDIVAIARALRENISGRSFQGASTITQQLIKSSLLTNELTITRKLKEVVLAIWAEHLYSKDEILEMYFNQIPYGGTAWGAQAASDLYFGKDVSELTLGESAFLAGIASAPTTYSPFGINENLWQIRQKEVLSKMVDNGFITQAQADEAYKTKLTFKPQQIAYKAPHFVEYVKDVLAKQYGLAMVERGGLIVTTSLDLSVQEMAQQIVYEEVEKDKRLNLSNGAALITDPTNGDILAMVGSKDFDTPGYGNVNITTSMQQPGSSIKVVTYAAALSNGYTAATVVEDTPVSYTSPGAPVYAPVNYDGRFRGRVPLRLAIANSLNIPAVKTLDAIGIDTMISYANSMGIDNWSVSDNYGLSITLGAAEVTMTDMAEVYGTLANEGERINLDPIVEVKDYKNTVYQQKDETPQGRQVLSEGVAFILSDILADNQARSLAFGPSSPLNIPGHRVSVKTGTTDDKRDNWTIGYTPDYVVTVWVGNNDNTPMSPTLASGITGAAPIWNRLITELLKNHPETQQTIPEDIVQRQCSGKPEYFIRGTENTARCTTIRPLSSKNTTEDSNETTDRPL